MGLADSSCVWSRWTRRCTYRCRISGNFKSSVFIAASFGKHARAFVNYDQNLSSGSAERTALQRQSRGVPVETKGSGSSRHPVKASVVARRDPDNAWILLVGVEYLAAGDVLVSRSNCVE